MSMYGYDLSFYDHGFSDSAITGSLYGNSFSPIAAAIDYDDGVFVRRRPPPRQRPPSKTPSSPPKHRHDGTSPLPLGMDWSLPPRIWDGRNSVWPHDSHKGWSYCVTVPSWTIPPSASGSDTVFFEVQVGIQSPEGITTTRGVLRRFNEFLQLYSELRKEFPKKNLPPAPPRRLMKMKSRTLLEERKCALEDWVEKLLSDIDVSRTALVAIFLELEAAARSSFYESNRNESAANPVPSDKFPPNSGVTSLESSPSIASELDNSSAFQTSDRSAPSPEIGSRGETFSRNSSVNLVDGSREDFPEGGLACEFSDKNVERTVASMEASNLRSGSLLHDMSLEVPETAEGLQGDLAAVLPSEERHKVNRVLITMQERLGTTKMDMEDLIGRLNQEIVAREYVTTKVKDLEMELETTSQSSKENLQHTILTERERSTHMQWDMEELRRKSMELESRLTTEQDARAYAESMKATVLQQNKTLLNELDDAKKQAEILSKQHDEVESKSKSDVKLLVKEVKSLRTSHSELEKELSKCLEEKVELEKEKQIWEAGNDSKVKLLHECEALRNQLRECSVNFFANEENKLIADTPLSDAINLLETSDSRIDHLLEGAPLLAQNAETTSGAANQDDNGDIPINGDDDLRVFLADIFTDNAKLRKQVNAVFRHALITSGKTLKDDVEDDA